jgi:O-antigen/teichoic acid export membrane protein
MISFLLNPLYVDQLPKQEFADVSIVFAWLVFFNVILSYGMETAFFRFYNMETDKKKVISTATISLFWSSLLFLFVSLLYRNTLSDWSGIKVEYITYTLWILALDALVILPFSKLRATQRPIVYAFIKIGNVMLNMLLNLFFLLLLPRLAQMDAEGFFNTVYYENFQVGYIFVSNLIASLVTFVILSPDYFKISWKFDFNLWKRMMQYGLPILIAGVAFAINEHFDKILLDWMKVSKSDIGAYSACYKIGMFMVLFRTAYTLGIEPFFFSHAVNENAQQTYATITKYFVIFGSFISFFVIAFIDLLKLPLVPEDSYWVAIKVVPLIVLANFFLGIYTNLSVWYKLIDKTRIGTYQTGFELLRFCHRYYRCLRNHDGDFLSNGTKTISYSLRYRNPFKISIAFYSVFGHFILYPFIAGKLWRKNTFVGLVFIFHLFKRKGNITPNC